LHRRQSYVCDQVYFHCQVPLHINLAFVNAAD